MFFIPASESNEKESPCELKNESWTRVLMKNFIHAECMVSQESPLSKYRLIEREQKLVRKHRSYRPIVWTGYTCFKEARQKALEVMKKD